MDEKEKQELYKKAIDLWGRDTQTMMLFEEIGELMTKINHSRRNRCKKSEVESEVADVVICLEFVKEILYLEDSLIDAKIEAKAEKVNSKLQLEKEAQ